MRLAPKLAVLKSQCAFDFRGADVQRIRASTQEFPVPDTLPNPDLVAALPRLRRYARVLTGDVHRADDLVQDTLARAWDKRHLWRAGSDLRAWLFTIMHNLHVNQFSLRQRERAHVSLDADDRPKAGWEVPVRATQSDRIEVNEVFAQIGRLPVEQREVLILAAVEGLRYDEMARLLGVPVGTVMSRLSRARERLKRMAGAPPSPPQADKRITHRPSATAISRPGGSQ
jgi:RNA polymerase sigma-70 factor (ECF subfamily)